jgi:hypothetical protein
MGRVPLGTVERRVSARRAWCVCSRWGEKTGEEWAKGGDAGTNGPYREIGTALNCPRHSAMTPPAPHAAFDRSASCKGSANQGVVVVPGHAHELAYILFRNAAILQSEAGYHAERHRPHGQGLPVAAQQPSNCCRTPEDEGELPDLGQIAVDADGRRAADAEREGGSDEHDALDQQHEGDVGQQRVPVTQPGADEE